MLSSSDIKILIKDEALRIKKRLGQNFLVDKAYIDRIISACSITKNDSVLEIGPGLGALTENIAARCKKLVAVEYDKNLCPLLKKQFAACENVEIICGSILDHRLSPTGRLCLASHSTIDYRLKIIGNLPYYITSPIISYIIDNRKIIKEAFITVQKEVAQRLVAKPGVKDYGSLSCFTQFYAEPKIKFFIPRKVFYPQPEVDSAFVNLVFSENPAVKVKDEKLFFKIINAAFNQRRKTLLNALSAAEMFNQDKKKVFKVLSDAEIDPQRRGETLSLEEFAKIEKVYENQD